MKSGIFRASLLVVASLASTGVFAQGEHPAYIHALEDLRYARFLLDRPADPRISDDELHAVSEIDYAINEIKHASIDDGKNIDSHPPVDAHIADTDRIHKALELLHKAHDDSGREEDNPHTRGLQERVIHHIDEAIHRTENILR